MNEYIIIIPCAAERCSHRHLTALSPRLHSKSRIFLLGEVNNLLILQNFKLSKRPLQQFKRTNMPWMKPASTWRARPIFWPFLYSSVICRVWLTVINIWFLLPSERDRVISSTTAQGRTKARSVFPYSMESVSFNKSLVVGTWVGIQSPSIQSLRWPVKCCSWTLDGSSQAFMWATVSEQLLVCVQWCGRHKREPVTFHMDRHGLTASDRWERKRHRAVKTAARLARGNTHTHTPVPPTKPVSHNPLSSCKGTVTERPHTTGEHSSV